MKVVVLVGGDTHRCRQMANILDRTEPPPHHPPVLDNIWGKVPPTVGEINKMSF